MKLKIKQWFNLWKMLRFSIYDITIAGIFLALFLIVDYISKITLTGRWAFSFEIGFYILFGIILGPIKGPILAILADSFSLLIFGRIGFWMWEYGVVPPIIAFVSWLFFFFYLSKSKWKIYVPHISLFLTAIIFFSFYISFIKNDKLVDQFSKREEISALAILVIASIFFCFSFIFISFMIYFYQKTNKEIFKTIIFVFAITTLILVLARWLWNPFAFISYYNRFIAPTRKSKTLRGVEQYYIFYLIPGILKSLVAIPIYSALLAIFLPVIFKLNHKYKNISHMAH